MKRIKTLLILGALATLSFTAGPKVPYTHQGFKSTDATQIAVNFKSVEDIEKSLEGVGPINVSFDIDDTLLYSSGYFYYGFNYGKELGFGENPGEVLHSQKFWDYVAEKADKESVPKASAQALINMHLKRGDKIFFITGRTKHSKDKNYTSTGLSKSLQKAFKLPYEVYVEYTADTPVAPFKYDKTFYIKKHDVSIHYGDSDDDILAAREAGIRGIRVQRAYNSTNPQKTNGGYGEEVIINSAW